MKTIKILGYDYNIIVAPEVKGGGMTQSGRCNISEQVIVIEHNQCKQARMSTVLHEVIEALDYHLELNLDHRTIMSLEAGLFQVLIDEGIPLDKLIEGVK